MDVSWFSWLREPWPWYVAGPVIGLIVPLLLLGAGKRFGISSSFRHLCAAALPTRLEFFRYDWRKEGGWNLVFVLGIALGGWIGAQLLSTPGAAVEASAALRADLAGLGLAEPQGLMPAQLASWTALATPRGFITLVVGGLLVGFGARWAGGCTSGHAITGLANLELPSLAAVLGFFAGGLIMTFLLLPLLIG
jgi:uncharacterized membrane protein YedE/YeeE